VISSPHLLAHLRKQLTLLERDLRSQAEDAVIAWSAQLRAEHARASERGRTALTWSQWRDGEVSQAAVAWLVATTFVRFCEDNHLLDGLSATQSQAARGMGTSPVWLAGPIERHEDVGRDVDGTARAVEHQQAHYEQHPTDNSRDWLQRAFQALVDLPAGRDLVDPRHNPVWRAPISASAADALLAFWRARDDEGTLVHDFTDPAFDTRFLGDLYQELSDYAKKTYALLQTPVFVEEFILDRTLTPAIDEFGLEGLKLIDPACGSGHFLLGAFARLVDRWKAAAPQMPPRERVQKALDSIHGVDVNPFAVAIARFRLTVAALQASGDRTLTAAPDFDYHVAIGDSLLGGKGRQQELSLNDCDKPFAYASEDLAEHPHILDQSRYHVVVGNPPYITVKDKALSEAYRKAYPTCHRQYALSVPFMELFFWLAKRQGPDGGAGFIGQITSNSFMKREFGTKLIEHFLSGNDVSSLSQNPVDLLDVIDTSGAYIPGHGTPTVILVGRRRRPESDHVKAVLGVRGEPGQPADAAKGLVWTEIVGHIGDESYDGTYVTVTDLPRETLARHPWSLSGGGAAGVMRMIESNSSASIGGLVTAIGRVTHTGADDAYFAPRGTWRRSSVKESSVVPLVEGDVIRDWHLGAETEALFPYDDLLKPSLSDKAVERLLWQRRAQLRLRREPGGTHEDIGLTWFEWSRWHPERFSVPLGIGMAFVATHNHFVLDRGGKVFNRSAPVIKLPADATVDDHLTLLGVLNSSTACFWLKQVSHDKGNRGGERSTGRYEWERFFEFTGTQIQQFPLPSGLHSDRGRTLDSLAQQLADVSPASVLTRFTDEAARDSEVDLSGGGGSRPPSVAHGDAAPTYTGAAEGGLATALADAHEAWLHFRARMIFEQEELDWHIYRLYGLLPEVAGELTYSGNPDTLSLGERAFEIALARQIAAGTEESAWFERHGSKPITELPVDWPADYRALVERRLTLMESNPHIRLLERPEYKRRWATTPWEAQQTQALRTAALDRLERPDLWRDAHGAVTLSVAQLADRTRGYAALRSVLELLAGTAQYDPVATLTALLKDEAVPYLAAHRYKESGLVKFREWQRVWDLQRREDAGENVTIPVPPKYAQADFRSTSYWRARGKLDVPKERFIAYPGVSRAGDASPVLGWAGWDHADQALALARAVGDMTALGASEETIKPLLAGLAELEPWLRQWHADLDPARGGSPAQAVTAMLDHELRRHGWTRVDLDEWAPPPPTRGRKPGARRAAKTDEVTS
jgi:hypothetical protein